MNDITTLVTTIGFPAAMCVIICYFCYKVWEAYRADIAAMRDVISECSKSVENNTEVLRELIYKERSEES